MLPSVTMQTPTPLVDELPTDLWIFGYGSLVWKNSDVPHVESKFCFVKGYKRRAWQGSTDHRGTVDAPGRVFSIYTKADFDVMGIAAEDSAELHPHSDDAWRVSGLALKVTTEHRKQVRPPFCTCLAHFHDLKMFSCEYVT